MASVVSTSSCPTPAGRRRAGSPARASTTIVPALEAEPALRGGDVPRGGARHARPRAGGGSSPSPRSPSASRSPGSSCRTRRGPGSPASSRRSRSRSRRRRRHRQLRAARIARHRPAPPMRLGGDLDLGRRSRAHRRARSSGRLRRRRRLPVLRSGPLRHRRRDAGRRRRLPGDCSSPTRTGGPGGGLDDDRGREGLRRLAGRVQHQVVGGAVSRGRCA